MIDKLETKDEMKYIKDPFFENVRSLIFSLEKQKNRNEQIKFGFIKPEDITKLDFQISMTKNKDEENAVKEIERHEDTEIND